MPGILEFHEIMNSTPSRSRNKMEDLPLYFHNMSIFQKLWEVLIPFLKVLKKVQKKAIKIIQSVR